VCIVSAGAQAAAATVIPNAHLPITEQTSLAGLQAQVVSVSVQQFRDQKDRKEQDRKQAKRNSWNKRRRDSVLYSV